MHIQPVLPLLLLQLITVVTSHQALYYELIYKTTTTTTEDGSVTLTCRDGVTANELDVTKVRFWLNRSSKYNQDLRKRKDFGPIEVIGCCTIKFNLTQSLEGYYTCGNLSKQGVQESPSQTLISLQNTAPLRANVRTTFTALLGGTAVLDCPNKPGALFEYYSVRWRKNDTVIANFSNGGRFNSTDARYDIDRSTFSLIISSVNMTDAGEGYQCEVYVKVPFSGNSHQLSPHSGSITLNIYGKARTSPPVTVIRNTEEQPSFICTVEHTGPAPNITWSRISKGVETNIRRRDPGYNIKDNQSRREDGRSVLRSTLTFLNLDMFKIKEVVVVRCRSGTGAESDAYLVKYTGT